MKLPGRNSNWRPQTLKASTLTATPQSPLTASLSDYISNCMLITDHVKNPGEKEVEDLSLCKSIATQVSVFSPVFLPGADPCYVSGCVIMDLYFSVSYA